MQDTSTRADDQESFTGRMKRVMSYGYMVPCIAVGYKLELFDKMAEFTEPVTSEKLAEVMDFKERYVRTWLSSMACFGVFDYTESSQTYFFPESHHSALTKAGGMQNVSSLALHLPPILAGYSQLITCFRKDGPPGVPFDVFTDVHESLDDSADLYMEQYMTSVVFKHAPALEENLRNGVSVCDIGCGNGLTTRMFATMFPNSTFHGCDIVEAAIQKATEASKESGLTNTSFSVQDICKLPGDWCESFDLVISIRVMHDLPYVTKALQHIHRCLKHGGSLYIMDGFADENPLRNTDIICRYTIELFHCLTQSLCHEGSEGHGLMWGKAKVKKMILDAGFSAIKELPDAMSFMNLVCEK